MKQLKTTLLLLASIIWQGAQAQETSTAVEGIDPNDPFEMQKPQSDNRAISSLTANFSPQYRRHQGSDGKLLAGLDNVRSGDATLWLP